MSEIFPKLRSIGLVAAVALAGMLASSPGARAEEKTTVTAALPAEPESLDPIFDTNLPALNIFYNVFDQLTGIDTTGKVIPLLATEWSHSDDLKTWTFKMRPGAKFQDGGAVTADDVVFTYETAKNDPGSRLGGYLTAIVSVKATGPDTVQFTLNTPFAPFDRQVTLVPIVSKAAYQKMGAKAFAKKPVGSGPYSVVSWAAGDAITLKRFDGYWGAKGNYENVVFQPVPDETTRANSVQSGDLDIALLGPSAVPAVKASGSVDVIDQQSNRILYVGFNSKVNWLKDPNIRKAIDMAIDRKALGEKLLNGSVVPTSQLVSSVTFGFDKAIPATAFNLEEAKKLVAASGYDGTPITLSYPTTGLPQIDQIAQAIGYFLKQAGIQVTFDGQEYNTYINNWFGSKFTGIYILAFAPSVMDADLPFNMLLRTGGQGYSFTTEIDKLLDAEVAEADPTARAALLSKVSQAVNAGTFYAPLFIDTYTYAVTKGIKWKPRPDGMIVFN